MSQATAKQPIEILDDRGNVLHRLDGNTFRGAHLANLYLRRAQLAGVDLRDANFRDTDLREANLIGADLRGASFEGSSLECAWLEQADLSGVQFPNEMCFKSAFMMEANLQRTCFSRCCFREARLERANFSHATVTNCDFTLAHLQEVIFDQAFIADCRLQAAMLDGADLSSARISGMRFGDGAWDPDGGASFDRTTKWPRASLLPLLAAGPFGDGIAAIGVQLLACVLIVIGLFGFLWNPMLPVYLWPVALMIVISTRLLRLVHYCVIHDDRFNFDEAHARLDHCRPPVGDQ